MKFINILSGTFLCGSPKDELNKNENEVQHEVNIIKSFEMQVTPVTQIQWMKVMGSNPSHFREDYLPVESVSWNDVQEFISKLNNSQSEFLYRLPTEYEWEYCCRAGSNTMYSFGNDDKNINNYAWTAANSKNKTHKVASLKPNDWGLYDMHGNVWEWVQNLHAPYTVDIHSFSNQIGSARGIRGGSWDYDSRRARSASRNAGTPSGRSNNLGFRLVRTRIF